MVMTAMMEAVLTISSTSLMPDLPVMMLLDNGAGLVRFVSGLMPLSYVHIWRYTQ